MKSIPSLIENISDTALWVAYARALESERPDALFQDPYARELAGERGARIAQSMRNEKTTSWYIALRTRIIDEILIQTIEKHHCDTVICLAAGLDTRPYRLTLPASLHWIDVDLPALLTYKMEKLAKKQPICSLEYVTLDLADTSSRRAFFERLGTQAKRVFVLMEGLSGYLTNAHLASLITDLHTQPTFQWLLTEFLTANGLHHMRTSWNKQLTQGNTQVQLTIDDTETFYREYGWEMTQVRLVVDEADTLKRKRFFLQFIHLMTFNNPQKRLEIYRDIGGFALFEPHA